jgi:septal ring factor EnvC (AmiA/AmiB activator)
MKGYSSRIQQAEDRISEPADEMEIKGKTEEKLLKQLKTYKRNMQELTNSIKRSNLRLMGIEENFPNLEKTMAIFQMQKKPSTRSNTTS